MEKIMNDKLVLIPGFANNELAWAHQIEALTDLFDIHVFIMHHETTRKEMVQSLLKEAPSRFILAGHSMGGWIAQATAALAPERIAKLVLLNTWATPDPKMISIQKQVCESLKLGQLREVMEQQLPLLIHSSRQQDLALIQYLQTMALSFPLEVLVRQSEAMLADYSSLHHHPAIAAPTLVIHSTKDILFPNEHEILLRGIKNAELAIIEDCGHVSTLEKPEHVTAILRSFVAND
jgi:pimeloyl-ACP methyl ester carboxylesterase